MASLNPKPKTLLLLIPVLAVLVSFVFWRKADSDAPNNKTGENKVVEHAAATGAEERPEPSQEVEHQTAFSRESLEVDNEEPESGFEALEILALEKLPPDQHDHNLGTWLGSFEPHPRSWQNFASAEAPTVKLKLSTPDGVSHQITFERYNKFGESKGIYSGSLKDQPFSDALISFVGEAVVGTLRIPSEGIAWEIRNRAPGVQAFEKVDLSKLPGCAACRHE
ncbi:hypothetical protein IEN85_15940 [Pelagicoccus sp. NFK12]|uniref:Uncharacterized protein n=1 Tax=Pelagicoccus enzymogenes TaxID=2773457 RepID=A0A927F9J4_9BACT|nr:hypothetical protein [Pelagicoccus enzymogenes]MBD5780992.1 hypothetical protein [Pelagicoccus enzymogenes]